MQEDALLQQKRFKGPFRILFTSYLIVVGFALLMALVQILQTHGMADGKFGLSVNDIVYSYYGNRGSSRLEAKLFGTMKDKATTQERASIVKWIREGSPEAQWNSSIQPIFKNKCMICHSSSQTALPALVNFPQVKAKAKIDKGASIQSITRFSHIHLFGISFIYFFIC